MSVLDIGTFYNTQDVKRFHFPGKILWGKKCRHRLFELVGHESRIALFVDAFFSSHPFMKEVQDRYGKQISLLEEIKSMPQTHDVRNIAAMAGNRHDVIVSIGGGSTIDTAKAVMAELRYGSFDGVGIGERRGIRPLPGVAKPQFISLPTTAGSGADASRYYVVYDSWTKKKVYGRSWDLVADWILLDPHFIEDAPDRLTISVAFDAFLHLFESFLCRYERSWFNDMLSVDGIARIMEALDRIFYRRQGESEDYLQLLYAATLAGMAVSNVRTGNVHEAAGALLEHTGLTHSETLFFFFRAAYEQYRGAIVERDALLGGRLHCRAPHLGINSIGGMVEWWEKIFAEAGIEASIAAKLKKDSLQPEKLRQAIFDRVNQDEVWCKKESPLPLAPDTIHGMITNAFSRFEIQ